MNIHVCYNSITYITCAYSGKLLWFLILHLSDILFKFLSSVFYQIFALLQKACSSLNTSQFLFTAMASMSPPSWQASGVTGNSFQHVTRQRWPAPSKWPIKQTAANIGVRAQERRATVSTSLSRVCLYYCTSETLYLIIHHYLNLKFPSN